MTPQAGPPRLVRIASTLNTRSRWNKTAYLLAGALSLTIAAAAHWHWIALGETEVWGFLTGGLTVWLTVEKSIWNWPVGIANNIFFFILFLQARLFADMALQVVYIVLSFLGWYWWLFGGEHKTELPVTTGSRALVAAVLFCVTISTLIMTRYLTQVGDAAPIGDALSTCLSLGAQFLLSKKLLANWYFWIAADILYIWLAAYKGLFLTSALYALFLAMCIIGLSRWRASLA